MTKIRGVGGIPPTRVDDCCHGNVTSSGSPLKAGRPQDRCFLFDMSHLQRLERMVEDLRKEESRRRYASEKNRLEKMKEEDPEKYESRMKRRREDARKRYHRIGRETRRRKTKEKRETMTEEEFNLERAKQQQYQRTYVEKRRREGTYEMLLSQKQIYGAKQRQSEEYKMDKQRRDKEYKARRKNDPVWHEEWKAKRRERAVGRKSH